MHYFLISIAKNRQFAQSYVNGNAFTKLIIKTLQNYMEMKTITVKYCITL